jgi:hypothetical protein
VGVAARAARVAGPGSDALSPAALVAAMDVDMTTEPGAGAEAGGPDDGAAGGGGAAAVPTSSGGGLGAPRRSGRATKWKWVEGGGGFAASTTPTTSSAPRPAPPTAPAPTRSPTAPRPAAPFRLGGLLSRSLQAAPQRIRPTAVLHQSAQGGSPPAAWMLAANVASP